jgi:OOP family OmpA-OmpF porin
MTMKKLALAAAMVTAALAASPAMAQATADRGWYVGGSFGQASADCDTSELPGFTCDEEDTAWKIFGGYQLNRNLALELGYANLGEVALSGFGFNADIETTVWELVGVASYPINNQFSLYGKLGLFRAETDLSSNFGASGDESTNGLTFAFGVRYDFTRQIGLRAEWQRYSGIDAPQDLGESDIDVLSVGVVVRF